MIRGDLGYARPAHPRTIKESYRIMQIATVALYAGLYGLLYLFLCFRVVQGRQRYRIGLGDGGNEDLQRAIRVQANFSEYVPLITMLLLILALSRSSIYLLHALGMALLVGRIAHAIGLSGSSGNSTGRLIGIVLTWICLLVAALLSVLVGAGIQI